MARKKKTFSKHVTVPASLRNHSCAKLFKLSNLYRAMRDSLVVFDASKRTQRHSDAVHDTVTQACIRHMDAFKWLIK